MDTGKIKQYEKTVIINGNPQEVFAFMDNIENTGRHMTKKNAAMMGSKLEIEWLTSHKTGLGAKYRWKGKAIGMKMDFTVEVKKWIESKEKVWSTVGDTEMIVLSWFEMYLNTELANSLTKARLGINYTNPKGSVLAFLFGRCYAKWCVKSMLRDTKRHFNELKNGKS
jgi:hypothetical protein